MPIEAHKLPLLYNCQKCKTVIEISLCKIYKKSLEDGGSRVLQNAEAYLPDYMPSCPQKTKIFNC
jgi:hypothetical protein